MNDKKVITDFYWRFDDLQSANLDPVTVFIEAYVDPTAPHDVVNAPFHITLHCYGECWTTFFSSPTGTPTEFLRKCSQEYMVDRLYNNRGKTKAHEKVERKYIARLWAAVLPLVMTNEERHAKYLAELVRELTPVNYTSHDQAPRFDSIVVATYVGNPDLFGAAAASVFDWNIAEGKPNIDKFWIIKDHQNDAEQPTA